MIIFSSSGNPEWYTIIKKEWKRRPKAFYSQEIIYISNNRERMKALDAKKEEKYAIDFLNQYNSIYLKLTS